MKKPCHGITLESAKRIVAAVTAGETPINLGVIPKAKEVISYWDWKRSK